MNGEFSVHTKVCLLSCTRGRFPVHTRKRLLLAVMGAQGNDGNIHFSIVDFVGHGLQRVDEGVNVALGLQERELSARAMGCINIALHSLDVARIGKKVITRRTDVVGVVRCECSHNEKYLS